MWDGAISIVSLSIVAVLCTVGVFSSRFEDTFAQRVGMSLIAVWCIARIQVKVFSWDTEPVHLLLHVGLALYAIGTALKIARRVAA